MVFDRRQAGSSSTVGTGVGTTGVGPGKRTLVEQIGAPVQAKPGTGPGEGRAERRGGKPGDGAEGPVSNASQEAVAPSAGASSAVPTTEDNPSTYNGTAAGRDNAVNVRGAVIAALHGLVVHFAAGELHVVSETPPLVRLEVGTDSRQVRIDVVPPTDLANESDVANFDLSATPAVIKVSANTRKRHVERALVHELAEIRSTMLAASGGVSRGPRDALHEDSPATKLSHHDIGRIAELKVLNAELADTSRPHTSAKQELRALLIHLGVHNPKGYRLRTEGPAQQRRALIEAELGFSLDRLEIYLRQQPDAQTDNGGLPLRGEHADPDAVERRNVTYEEVDAAIPNELVSALEKFGLTRQTVVTYCMNHHNDRSRQRYLPDLEGLIREHAPLGMMATDVWAIDLYTTRLFFSQLNRRLRLRKDVDTTTDIEAVLNSALAKLPVHAGAAIYRTLAIDPDALAEFLADHPVDQVVTWKAFTSMAGDVGGTFWDKPEQNVLFIVRNSDSHDISKFADGINYRDPPNPRPELLMPSNITVKVTAVEEVIKPDGSTGHKITFEQVRAPATIPAGPATPATPAAPPTPTTPAAATTPTTPP